MSQAASQIQRCGQKAFELAEFVESLNKLDKASIFDGSVFEKAVTLAWHRVCGIYSEHKDARM